MLLAAEIRTGLCQALHQQRLRLVDSDLNLARQHMEVGCHSAGASALGMWMRAVQTLAVLARCPLQSVCVS